jgi:hypothetical protein
LLILHDRAGYHLYRNRRVHDGRVGLGGGEAAGATV